MKQQIKEQEIQVQVVERTQEIVLQEQEILRKEKSLEAKIRAPAEAEKFRLETIAEAEKVSTYVNVHYYTYVIMRASFVTTSNDDLDHQ